MRVYLTSASQAVLESATSVRPGSAQLIWVYVDVDSVPFNKGFLHRGRGMLPHHGRGFPPASASRRSLRAFRPIPKRVILYGSEGAMRTFVSTINPEPTDTREPENFTMPIGVVETVEPILLSVKALDNCQLPSCPICELGDVPEAVSAAFDFAAGTGRDQPHALRHNPGSSAS